jgi:hypothetical protein
MALASVDPSVVCHNSWSTILIRPMVKAGEVSERDKRNLTEIEGTLPRVFKFLSQSETNSEMR